MQLIWFHVIKDGRSQDLHARMTHRTVLVPTTPNATATHLQSIQNRLADDLVADGKYSEAETVYRKVLALEQRLFGAEHPTTLGTANNLAGCLHCQRKFEEAIKLHKNNLRSQRRVPLLLVINAWSFIIFVLLPLRVLFSVDAALVLASTLAFPLAQGSRVLGGM